MNKAKSKPAKTRRPKADPSSEHPIIHLFGYGDPFSEKSTCAASFPYPMIVWNTDGLGKEAPYLRRFCERMHCSTKSWKGEEKQQILSLMQDDAELCRIEFYNNINPSVNAFAYDRLHTRMQRFAREREYKQFKTGVFDSASGLIDIAQENQQYQVNQGEPDDMLLKWANNVTNNAHTIIKGLSFLPINIVVLAHIAAERVPLKIGKDQAPTHPHQQGMTEFQNAYMRSVALPGRLGRNINIVASKFPEFYRFYVEDGKAKIQTVSDGEWVAGSQIQAPNGCKPRYSELWKKEIPKGGGD